MLETLDLNLTKALTDIVNSISLKLQPQLSSTFSSLAPWPDVHYKRNFPRKETEDTGRDTVLLASQETRLT